MRSLHYILHPAVELRMESPAGLVSQDNAAFLGIVRHVCYIPFRLCLAGCQENYRYKTVSRAGLSVLQDTVRFQVQLFVLPATVHRLLCSAHNYDDSLPEPVRYAHRLVLVFENPVGCHQQK